MPTAIALRHVAFEDLGSFAPVLARRGFEIAYREAAIDDFADPGLQRADLLIVLGGPIGAYEESLYPFLIDELATIERRLAAQKPVLGICLGSQLMARALGARVYPGHGKEIGWSPLTLSEAGRASPLAPFAAGQPVLHWHGDTFDLPQGAVHLAASARYQNQAFAWRRHGLALQFHIEAEARGLERWYVGHAAEIAATEGVEVPRLRRDAERHAAALAPLAARCLESWLETALG
jgi:GMP synthase (glutamine-hydrolysing)